MDAQDSIRRHIQGLRDQLQLWFEGRLQAINSLESDLLGTAMPSPVPPVSTAPPPNTESSNGKHAAATDLESPAMAVLTLLSKHSGGLTSQEINCALHGRIKSTGKSERNTISTTLYNLSKKSGRIRHDKTSKRYQLAAGKPDAASQSPNPNGLKPKAAVLALLGSQSGLTKREVVDRLVDEIDTNATKPRQTLRQTVCNLVQDGEAVERDGKLYLVTPVT